MCKIVVGFSLLSLIWVLSSCSERSGRAQNNNIDYTQMDVISMPEMETVDFWSTDKGFYCDAVVADFQYVKLADTGKDLIGNASDLFITPEHIVVVDQYKSQSIFVFNRKGETVSVISRLGRGPQEYTQISDVELTPDQKQIVVMNSENHKMLYYNMSGQFLQSKPLAFYASYFAYLDENNILISTYGFSSDPGLASYSQNRDLLYFVDSTLQIQRSTFPNRYTSKDYHAVGLGLSKFGDNVYVNPAYCDTIYRITPDAISARYQLDLGPNGAANFEADMTDEKLDQIRKTKTLFCNTYADADQFALFHLIVPRQSQTMLYAKESKRSYRLNGGAMNPLLVYTASCLHSYKNQFVIAVPAYRVLTSKEYPEELHEQYRINEICENLTEDSNPVIFFYTMQEPKTKE